MPQVLAAKHNFLDRNALLLRAVKEGVTQADYDALSDAGLRK